MNQRLVLQQVGVIVIFYLTLLDFSFAQIMIETLTFTSVPTSANQHEEVLSKLAVSALRNIADARHDIHQKNNDRAQRELKEAMQTILLAKTLLPVTKVRNNIMIAKKHLAVDSHEEVLNDIIPIYASLGEIDELLDTKQVREHISRAEVKLKSGDKKGAEEHFDLASADLVYTEIDLPLGIAEHQVITAQGLLAKGEDERAEEALKVAEESVNIIGVAIYSPLYQAEKGLYHASKSIIVGEVEHAKRGLHHAKVSLLEEEQIIANEISNELKILLKEIDSIEKHIVDEEKLAEGALEELWRKVKNLRKLEMKYWAEGLQFKTYPMQ